MKHKSLFFLVGFLWAHSMLACTSDCTSCHPKLDVVNDPRHQALSTCIVCHHPENVKMSAAVGCGTDCFKCHATHKLVQTEQHKVITACMSCHKTMDKTPFVNLQEKEPVQDNAFKNLFKKEIAP